MVNAKVYNEVLRTAFFNHYIESSDEWTNDAELRSIPSIILGYLKLDNYKRSFLDIGCGTGLDCGYFADVFDKVVGIDLYRSKNWIDLSKRYQNLNFSKVSIFDYKSIESFDLILDNGCFHHQHPDKYLDYFSCVKKLLKKDGYFILTTFKNHVGELKVDPYVRFHRWFTDKELKTVLYSGGFFVENQIDVFRKKNRTFYRITFTKQL